MNIDDVSSSSCDLFREGKFTECCELLQRTIDGCHLKTIEVTDEIAFITLRNNLLVCNCLRILPAMSTEYVGKMTELIAISELYLYEKHVPLVLRVNFVCNTLHWYWLRPAYIPDYCYNKILTLIDDCLHEVLYESGKSVLNLSSHVGKEHDIIDSLECLSNKFLSLEPILVVQCLEISQILLFVFLSRRQCLASLLVHFTTQLIDKIKTLTSAFNIKKSNNISNCFKLGISRINTFLNAEHIKTIIVSGHVGLCLQNILENQYRQALCALSTVDQYLEPNSELFCLACYLRALVNFNLEEFEVTLYYLSQMADYLMEPFIKSRCYLLLGRTYSKMGNNDLAISTFEKLKTTQFNKIMAYYMSQHYEMNNMQFSQMMVLEQAIKGNFDRNNDEDLSISFISKILFILYPQPDLTRRQLLYMAAKKKYEFGNYKLAASAYLSLLRLNEFEQYVSDMIMIPSYFMLQHETAVTLLKAHEVGEAFKLCRLLIDDFEPGCGMWKSDSFWANELNDYNCNVIGTMLLAEIGVHKNPDIVLESLNKSFNCLYSKINYDNFSETSNCDENIKTLRKILIGKILLLRATVLSRLNLDKDCEAAFQKALAYNSGDEDIVYLYSKWLEHKGKISQSRDVRGQYDRNKTNTITCDNVVINYVLENKHGLEDALIGDNVMDDLFANTEDQVMNDLFVSTDDKVIDVDNEMDPADDDILNQLFID